MPRKVGSTCRRLAAVLRAGLEKDGWTELELEAEKLSPAQGHWRTSPYADVNRWDGSFKGRPPGGAVAVTFGLASWDTMTDVVRHGFTWTRDVGSLEIHANKSRRHPALVKAEAIREGRS